MEREQVVKALQWCSELRLCVDCPMRAEGYFSHSGNACRQSLMRNALALIKEFTEENERLKAEKETLEIIEKDLRFRNKELQKANEGLAKQCDELEEELNYCGHCGRKMKGEEQ